MLLRRELSSEPGEPLPSNGTSLILSRWVKSGQPQVSRPGCPGNLVPRKVPPGEDQVQLRLATGKSEVSEWDAGLAAHPPLVTMWERRVYLVLAAPILVPPHRNKERLGWAPVLRRWRRPASMVSRSRYPDLVFDDGGCVVVRDTEGLARVLAHHGTDVSELDVDFSDPGWQEMPLWWRADLFQFLDQAIVEVTRRGLLPARREPFPPMGAQGEALISGEKPRPSPRWRVGTLVGYSWDGVFRTWRVEVRFDSVAGSWCGSPIRGVSTWPDWVHVIGASDRAFSEMSSAEVDRLIAEPRSPFKTDEGSS